jgi:hypothetical protein
MPKWLDDILSSRKETEKESPTEINREISLGPRLSSVEQSAKRQRDERAMKERLDAFLKVQKEEDEDGDFTTGERDQATNAFLDQEGETPPTPDKTLKDMQKKIDELYALLEGNQRLIPAGADDNDTLQYILGKPEWGVGGGLPPITDQEKEHMCLVLVDVAGDLVVKWAYKKLQ